MSINIQHQYHVMLTEYWRLFKKHTEKFERSDAYWQELLHDAEALYQEFRTLNEELSYSLAISIVKAVEHEFKRWYS